MIENTVKKKQHYLPKFYLRNFSYKGNAKQIGIYHLETGRYCQTSTLKDQGSKNFFYGADGIIEDHLSNVEGLLSKSIKKIVESSELPKPKSDDHYNLLMFILLTDLRNPVRIKNTQEMLDVGKTLLQEQHPGQDIDALMPSINHKQAIGLALSQLTEVLPMIDDLGYKFLVNKTKIPFISSDFPIVKYNQFLEKLKWKHGKTGFGTMGLQVIVPLSPNLLVFFYDKAIYKVGDKKKGVIELKDEEDINQLNVLQFVNCFETTYFNGDIGKEYMIKIHDKAKKYPKPNVMKAEMHYMIKRGQKSIITHNNQKNLIITGSSDCETKLRLSFVRLQTGVTKTDFGDKASLIRAWPLKLMELRGR